MVMNEVGDLCPLGVYQALVEGWALFEVKLAESDALGEVALGSKSKMSTRCWA